MSERDDALLERVLQQVEHPGLEDPGLDLEGDELLVWREYGELAGMLPSALEPVEPPQRLLGALLAAVREESVAGAALESVSRPESSVALPVASSDPRPSPSWRAVAAVLAVLAIGLSGIVGWLLGERSHQQDAIADLERRVESIARRDRALEHAQQELEPLRSVVTSAGMRACPLRPWGKQPQQPWARAVVYFDGNHHQSYLVARDLEPCRQGSRYVLWFLVDGKPVPGGSFQAQKGVPVALSAEEVPDETRGAFLTLEPDPGAEKPTGQPILYGEGAEEML